MLQLRLWLTVVVIVLTGGLVLLLGTSALHERVMLPFEQLSTQAISALSGHLAKQAADSVDAATRASVDEEVRAAAKKGEMTPAADAALLARAGSAGAPAFALLVKPDGTIGARVGSEIALEGALTGLPAFADAATGVARDGLHIVSGKPIHLAAAPIYDGAALSAVVMLGWPYDAALAERLSQQVGAPIVLVVNDQRLGTGLADLTDEELQSRGSGVGALDLGPELGRLPKEIPIPFLLPDTGRYLLASLPVFGTEGSVSAVAGIDRNEAFRAIATAQVFVIIGALLLAILQMTLIVTTMRAVNKPIEVIVSHLSQVSQGNSVGILPEAALTGQFLRLGKQVNMILQMMPSAARPGAPLGALARNVDPAPSAPAPAPSLASAALAADGDLDSGLPPLGRNAPPAAPIGDINLGPPSPGSGSMPRAPSAPSASPPSGLSGLFDDNAPDPLAAFRVPPKGPSGPSAPSPGVTASAAPQNGHPAMGEPPPAAPMSPEATVMFQVPQELINESAQSPQRPPGPAAAAKMPANDARTVVAEVPQELLSAAAPRTNVTNVDEAHYREVYDKFVQTRVDCGEDTSDLTYERFVAKLLKNRQQIVEKHKAKSVRFQVYVKEGKAALRALPVRD
jgi:hypothetical protein